MTAPRGAPTGRYLREGPLDAAESVLRVHRVGEQFLPHALNLVRQLLLRAGGLMKQEEEELK